MELDPLWSHGMPQAKSLGIGDFIGWDFIGFRVFRV